MGLGLGLGLGWGLGLGCCVPCVSALSKKGTSLALLRVRPTLLRVKRLSCTCRRSLRYSHTSRARASEPTTRNSSPARGSSRKPLTRTGVEGPACLIGLPASPCNTCNPHSVEAATPCTTPRAAASRGLAVQHTHTYAYTYIISP